MEGEEVYEGDYHSTRDFGGWIFGALLDLQRGVEFGSWTGSIQALVCWRFWARGLGYSYDILELGSYLVGRVELGFGQRLQCNSGQQGNNKVARQGELASDPCYLSCVLFFFAIRF